MDGPIQSGHSGITHFADDKKRAALSSFDNSRITCQGDYVTISLCAVLLGKECSTLKR